MGAARPRLGGVAARLAAGNVLGASLGFVTGPLLARELGASGRGDLAAVVVPFTLASAVLGLGIQGYAVRELPRGRPVGDVIGSLGLPLLILGAIAVAAAVPMADALAGGRETVRAFLIAGFVSMPLVLIGNLLLLSLGALELWRRVVATNLTPFVTTFVAIVVLFLAKHLTVATAAAATIGGSLLSIVPGLPLLWAGRPAFRPSIARAAIGFGLKGWVGGLAALTNARLDQLLMITAVAPRVLGLYAVAVTIAGAATVISGGVSLPLMARVAAGERHLMSQAVRIVIAATVVVNAALAIVTPFLLSALFGPQFEGAYPMALILFLAQVPLAGAFVLSAALQADGAPLIPTIGEGIAVVITVPGLAVLLGPWGGEGAAVVSLAAYGASFAFQLVMARRRTGLPVSEFLVPTRSDVSWARGRITDLMTALRIAR